MIVPIERPEFFKYPSTPHLALLPGVIVRSDKLMTEEERDGFLKNTILVEEKVDGANLGLSFNERGDIFAQARGKYLDLPGSGQWKKLSDWLEPRIDSLFENLSDRYILFGEWCYAKHTIFYDSLPDWFLAFDVYDREARCFLSTSRRGCLLEKMQLEAVPILGRGRFSLSGLEEMISRSKLANDQPAEGAYLRFDLGDLLGGRAKLVRRTFIQEIEEHWSRRKLVPNRLKAP